MATTYVIQMSALGRKRTFGRYASPVAPSPSIKAVDALLVEQGFLRHGSAWVRERGLFSDIVDLQRGTSVEGITVNVALMHAATFELAWGKPPTSPTAELDCIVRTRLGFLMDGRDRWWRPGDDSAVGEMIEAVASAALPFLADFQNLADVERWLDASLANRSPPEALYRAAIKWQLGNDREARDILERLLGRTSEPWRKRIAMMANSLS